MPKSTNKQSNESPIHLLNTSKDTDVINQLAKLEKRLFNKSASFGNVDDLLGLATRRNTFLLYMKSPEDNNNSPIAYILYTVNSTVAHISKLLVIPELRRQGVATLLVKEACDKARRERRVSSVTLHVDTSNEPALKLYEGLGFVREATFEDFYTNGRHAYKMRLSFDE